MRLCRFYYLCNKIFEQNFEMGNEKAQRIQTSILNATEKKALVWLAGRQPLWMTSDKLTFIGVVGAFICALGFILSSCNIYWLWLSCAGLVINWYGDSLDGTLARVRNTPRPKYGFFIDHTLDVVTICVMCIGAGLSPIFSLSVALFVLVGYLALSIFTYVTTIVNNEMRLTYGALGPTEFRLIIIIINIIVMYTPFRFYAYDICGEEMRLFDIIGGAIAIILGIIWFCQFFSDRARLAKLDPLPEYKPSKKRD